jgi:signal transduction histidine kinase
MAYEPATAAPTSTVGRMIRQLGIDTGYNLIGLVMAVVSFSLVLTLLVTGIGTLIIGIGLPILAFTMLIARGLGDVHRVSLRSVVKRPSPRPLYPAEPANAGWLRRMINPIVSGQSWLDVAAALIDLPFAIFSFVVTVTWWSVALGGITYALWDWTLPTSQRGANGIVVNNESLAEFLGFGNSTAARIGVNELIGVFFLLTLPLVVRLAALSRAHVNRALLCGVAELRRQISGLQEQKQAAASAEATALRRLERDIHDGPQQRLVRLAMDLGRARQQLDTDDRDAARATIEEALGQTRETLDELRALSRGIAPPILTDRGLPSALAALGGRCPVPVDLAVDPDLGRLDPGVESAAYFVAAESLTNVAKHSHASTCAMTVVRAYGKLGVVIVDDGVGGASIAKGHGLSGLHDRVHAAGGTLTITSPTGGPTEIRAEIPCA